MQRARRATVEELPTIMGWRRVDVEEMLLGASWYQSAAQGFELEVDGGGNQSIVTQAAMRCNAARSSMRRWLRAVRTTASWASRRASNRHKVSVVTPR
jgi:hypothetical protein